ncbi:MAG TPA: hypothetical protein VFG08_01230 [Candidatus Polarisedimenticolia bacterium]|nr:hypothetical protein [Candidatus Polarisedimenticolia bacterium]
MRRYVLILILLLPTLAGGPGCLQPPPTAATLVKRSPLRVLPQQSVGLLVLDVRTLRDRRPVAAWLSDLAARTEREGAFQALMERFGGQILSQLDRVALAAVPMQDEQLGFGLLAEGEFDEATLREALGGSDILTVLEIADEPDLSVTVLTGGILGVGPRTVLEGMRRNAAAKAGGLADNRVLMTLLERVESNAQVWGAIDYAPMAKLAGRTVGESGLGSIPLPGGTPGGSLRAIAFQGTIDDPVDFEVIGQAALEDDAARLADAARGLVAIGRMAAAGNGDRAELLALLDAIDISQSGAFVNLRGSVPVEVLTRLAGGLTAGGGSVGAGREAEAGAPPPGGEPNDPGRPDVAETVP